MLRSIFEGICVCKIAVEPTWCIYREGWREKQQGGGGGVLYSAANVSDCLANFTKVYIEFGW